MQLCVYMKVLVHALLYVCVYMYVLNGIHSCLLLEVLQGMSNRPLICAERITGVERWSINAYYIRIRGQSFDISYRVM